MNKVIIWVNENKEWFFSGIGVTIVTLIFAAIRKVFCKKKQEKKQTRIPFCIHHFRKRSYERMLAIINASEQDYNDLSNAIGNSKDATQDMADTMLDNLAGSMTLI